MINRTTFFSYARRAPFGGRLTTEQVKGCEAILDACRRERVTDLRRIAYILASVFHETGGTMAPVRETFARSDAQAMDRLEAAWRAGKLKGVTTPYWRDGWFGRGLIQLTHRSNYEKMGARLDLPLTDKPNLVLDLETSARIAVVGMNEGLFTGKKLSDYFHGETTDPVGAGESSTAQTRPSSSPATSRHSWARCRPRTSARRSRRTSPTRKRRPTTCRQPRARACGRSCCRL